MCSNCVCVYVCVCVCVCVFVCVYMCDRMYACAYYVHVGVSACILHREELCCLSKASLCPSKASLCVEFQPQEIAHFTPCKVTRSQTTAGLSYGEILEFMNKL